MNNVRADVLVDEYQVGKRATGIDTYANAHGTSRQDSSWGLATSGLHVGASVNFSNICLSTVGVRS